MKAEELGIALVGGALGVVIGFLWMGDLGMLGGAICGMAGIGVVSVIYRMIRKKS